MAETNLEQELEKIAEEVSKGKSDHFANMQESLLKKVFIEKQTPFEVMGFSPETLEAIYNQAYQRYKAGKYDEAAEFFKFLINLDPSQSRFSLGLGAAYHMQKKYYQAIEAYMLSHLADTIDPIPFYHMSDCWIRMEKPQCAIFALETMLKKADHSKEFTQIVQRAKMTLATLKEQVKEEEEKINKSKHN